MVSERDAADFGGRQQREREAHDRNTAVTHVSDAVLQRLNLVADRLEKQLHPIELKRKFATYIQRRVRCPGFQRSEAEKAAGYVLDSWPGERALPEHVMEKLLDELDDADEKKQVSKYVDEKTAEETGEPVGGGRGKWFNGVLRLRLKDYGITQRKKGVRRR